MTAGGDFWARRKAAVQSEQEAEEKALEARRIEEERAELEEKSDAEILAELGLPDPDTIEPGTDVAGFMKAAVPDRLRRRALRRLWRINPVLANIDGLVDYGEDFTDAATVVENLQTTYQVGKGMLRHVEEMARQAAEAEENAVKEQSADSDTPEDVALAESSGETTTENSGESSLRTDDTETATVDPAPETMPVPQSARPHETDSQEPDTHEPEMTALPRRRLRFAFEDSPT